MVGEGSHRRSALLGVLLVVAAVTLFAVLDAAAKVLAETQSVVQIVWGRYAFALPLIIATTPLTAWSSLYRVERPLLQVGRALMPVIASYCVVVGLIFLPLAEVTALTFASPLVVVALSAPLLRERTSIHDWIGVIVGFIGIVVIVRPGSGALAWAALFPLGCAFSFALYQLATRFVGRTDHPAATLAWTLLVGLLATTPLLPFDWRPMDLAAWAWMAVAGLSFGGAQYLLIRAFRLAPAAVLTPFTYSQIVPAVLFGLFLFGTVPDLWAVIGTAMVIAGGLYVLARRMTSSQAPAGRSAKLA
jgi:drug/metabolite transporter (DMT)-like permease